MHDEKLKRFAMMVTEHQIQRLQERNLDCAANIANATASIKKGNKYTKVDIGTGGRFMVDQEGNIYGIKAYGQVHKGHHYGTLDTINDWWWGEYYPVKKGVAHAAK